MKYFILSILVYTFANTSAHGQNDVVSVYYYMTTEDYLAGNLSAEEIDLEVKDQQEDFFIVKDMIDPATGKGSKDGRRAWAFEYNDDLYIHLKYSQNSPAYGVFVRQHVVGRFCLSILGDQFIDAHNKSIPNTYGGGLTGVILDNSGMWGGAFLDSNGIKKKIFFTDTKHRTETVAYRGNSSKIDMLTASTLKWLTGKEDYSGRKWDYSVEEIVAIVEDLNQRQKEK